MRRLTLQSAGASIQYSEAPQRRFVAGRQNQLVKEKHETDSGKHKLKADHIMNLSDIPEQQTMQPSQSDSERSVAEDVPADDTKAFVDNRGRVIHRKKATTNSKGFRKPLQINKANATVKVRKTKACKSKLSEPRQRRPYKSFTMDRLQRNYSKTEVRLLLAVKRKDVLQKKYDNYKFEMKQRELADAEGVAVGQPGPVAQADL